MKGFAIGLGALMSLSSAPAVQANAIFQSHFEVVSPASLQKDYQHRDALFGKAPFGGEIESNIFYTSRSLCDDEPDPGTPNSIRNKGYVLMVDRGGCSFVTKTRNAQKAQASAVIFADNRCLCRSGNECVSDETCQTFEPVLDDDGTGSDIDIPAMILMKQHGDMLRDRLMSGTMIKVKLSWPANKTNGPVDFTLWTTPDDLSSLEFLSTFKQTAMALGDRARFRPQMYMRDGTDSGCRHDNNDSELCSGECVNFGRYCAPENFEDEVEFENKGAKLMAESLRRACIWDIYGEVDGVGVEWWTYMEKWLERCSHSKYSATCAEERFEEAGIDKDAVLQCMQDSGEFWTNTPNTLLEDTLNARYEDSIYVWPTMIVNGAVLRGELTYANVLDAICWSYADNQDVPAVCNQWKTCSALCPSGNTCAILDNKCDEYLGFETAGDMTVYDDDFIGYYQDYQNVGETEPEETDAPVAPPSNPPVPQQTPGPTPAPVLHPTDAPLSDPTMAPVPEATNPPVPAPTDAPVVAPTQPPQMPEQKENGGEKIVETIQIYENGNGGGGGMDRDAAFAIGLGVGIGVMVLGGLVAFLVVRDNKRQSREMQPLVYAPYGHPYPPPGAMSHYGGHRPGMVFKDDGSYLEEMYNPDGEDDFGEEEDVYVRRPPRRPRRKFKPWRSSIEQQRARAEGILRGGGEDSGSTTSASVYNGSVSNA